MQDKSTRPAQQSPADIAREAFHRLAARRIAPTPEAYREQYDQVAGFREPSPTEAVLAEFAASLTDANEQLTGLSSGIARALEARDWEQLGKQLRQLTDEHLRTPAPQDTHAKPTNPIEVAGEPDRKSTRLNSSHPSLSRMPSSA